MQSKSSSFLPDGNKDDFKNLTHLSPAATCIVTGGNVNYINPAGLRLFGAEAPGDIIGKSFFFLFHPDHRDGIAENLHSIENSSKEFETEERLNRVDGKLIIALMAVKSITFDEHPAILAVFHDITELKKTENDLRISQEHYRSLLSKLPDYVFIQVDGKIVYVNESMLKAGNYEPEEMLNKPVFNFIDEKYHKVVIEGINRRLSGSENDPIEIEIILKSGKRRTVLAKGELIRYEDKNALLIVSVDITHKKLAEEQLKRLNASKDKFFSIIAHDLKGPFNGLLGFTTFLANDIESLEKEEISQFAFDINKSAQDIYNLLNNLLEWARVQTEDNYCKPSKLNLSHEVKETIKILKKNIEQKALKVRVDIDNNITVLADKHMLHSIIQNLAANAVKFTNTGGMIAIRAEMDTDHVEISVSDTGTGISSDTLNKLFKIDENITIAGTNNEKGTGLGLILCKEFVEKNGGNITVKSIPGKGSIFSFTLPVAAN